MKRFSLITLSAIATLGLASPSFAQSKVTINTQNVRPIVEITPFDLVTAGYQGRFLDQGIPAGSRFANAVKNQKITAEDLVQTAIAAGRLPETTLNDQGYLRQVRNTIKNLDRN